MKNIYTWSIGLVIVLLVGCTPGPNSGKGFSLPEGSSSNGKAAFVELGCNSCHSTKDVEQLSLADKTFPSVELGGPTRTTKTYGELVTSIINPSHKISTRYRPSVVVIEDGTSTMKIYNDVMTVTQLVDLVTYLESQFEVFEYRRTTYPKYGQ
jgi:hypothetical protein